MPDKKRTEIEIETHEITVVRFGRTHRTRTAAEARSLLEGVGIDADVTDAIAHPPSEGEKDNEEK